MEQESNYYLEKINSNKKTGYLFGVIPFAFQFSKEIGFFYFAIFFISFGIVSGLMLTSFLLFLLISHEYSRISDYREKVLCECITNEEIFKMTMREDGIDPNFPHDPLYVTNEDRDEFFMESLYLYSSHSFFKKLSLGIVIKVIFRS